MSRHWSKEEDDSILEGLRAENTMRVTKEIVEEHNGIYGVIRTEATYNTRVIKIAKENKIDRMTSRVWRDEEKEYVMRVVNEDPMNPPWGLIAEHLNRSEVMVKKIYNDNMSTMDHIDNCIRGLHLGYIDKMIETIRHSCAECPARIYSKPCMWEGSIYCDECHYMKWNKLIVERWIKIREYTRSTGKDKCNICERLAPCHTYLTNRFHFDHKNMFDKEDSIYSMVHDGTKIDDIYSEIDKCQLLCASCHAVVTKVETQCGFTGLKRELNREYAETEEDSKKEELKKQYAIIYDRVMTNVYEMIKEAVK
jgi:hypothetical protein